MTDNLYYFLLPYCFIVKGNSSNIIFNAQKNAVTYIPESIIFLIELFESYSVSEIENIYSDQAELLKENISYLRNKGLIAVRKKHDIFPKIKMEYHSPEHIKHMVIEYSDRYDISISIAFINLLLVKFLEIRFSDKFDINIAREIISQIYKSSVKSVQLVIDYEMAHGLFKLCKESECNIISNIIFFNAPFCRSEEWGRKQVQYIKSDYQELRSSNNNYSKNFIFDLKYFILSHSYNPYYYKRLCIDKDGNLKNCLKNNETFGNIIDCNINVIDVINSASFKKLWYVSCDKIKEIKNNPLRYNMYLTNDLREIEEDSFSIIQ